MAVSIIPKKSSGIPEIKSVAVSGLLRYTFSGGKITSITEYPTSIFSSTVIDSTQRSVTFSKSGCKIVGIGSLNDDYVNVVDEAIPGLDTDGISAYIDYSAGSSYNRHYGIHIASVRPTTDGGLQIKMPVLTGSGNWTHKLRFMLYYIET